MQYVRRRYIQIDKYTFENDPKVTLAVTYETNYTKYKKIVSEANNYEGADTVLTLFANARCRRKLVSQMFSELNLN